MTLPSLTSKVLSLSGSSFSITGEYQQERRQRPELVDPHSLLELHPFYYLCGVISSPPTLQVDHHHSGVEVTRLPTGEGERQGRVGPKRWRKIGGEIGIAVFRSGEDRVGTKRSGGELGNVIDEYQVQSRAIQLESSP